MNNRDCSVCGWPLMKYLDIDFILSHFLILLLYLFQLLYNNITFFFFSLLFSFLTFLHTYRVEIGSLTPCSDKMTLCMQPDKAVRVRKMWPWSTSTHIIIIIKFKFSLYFKPPLFFLKKWMHELVAVPNKKECNNYKLLIYFLLFFLAEDKLILINNELVFSLFFVPILIINFKLIFAF